MKYLTRDDIWAAKDIQFFDVPVPEWGGTVRVRSLNGLRRSELLRDMKEGNTDDWIERLVAASACNEDGEPIFTNNDIGQLAQKNAAALNRVFEKADELNNFSDRAQEKLAGESEPTPK